MIPDIMAHLPLACFVWFYLRLIHIYVVPGVGYAVCVEGGGNDTLYLPFGCVCPHDPNFTLPMVPKEEDGRP